VAQEPSYRERAERLRNLLRGNKEDVQINVMIHDAVKCRRIGPVEKKLRAYLVI